MPFLEKKSFSMPCISGSVVLPEIREVKKVVDGSEQVVMTYERVDQAHKDLPEGKEKLAYSLAGTLKAGIPREKIGSIMLYPKSLNLVDSVQDFEPQAGAKSQADAEPPADAEPQADAEPPAGAV